MQLILTPELMIEAYRQGLFPMAYNTGSPYIHWICPDMRGQLSITGLHIPRSLKKLLRQNLESPSYEIRIDTAFKEVIDSCAESTTDRPESWINKPIRDVFIDLHKRGDAHSIEYWQNGVLKGGLYGMEIGGAFFGESMFSRTPNASKLALVHLTARLWAGEFALLDTQFVNDHLKQFGVYEIPHAAYKKELLKALGKSADFFCADKAEHEILADYLYFRSEDA